MWICNIELKKNKKISKNGDIPEGWVKGRNKWNQPQTRPKISKPKQSKKKLDFHVKQWEKFKSDTHKRKQKDLYFSQQREIALKYLDLYVECNYSNLSELHFAIKYESSPQCLVHFLKRYCKKEYHSIIQPRFKGKKHKAGTGEVSNWT